MPTLTDVDVRNAKLGEHTDGDGLILVVRASRSGSKLRRAWVLRIVDGGRRRKLGLGVYPAVGLGQARQRAAGRSSQTRRRGRPPSPKRGVRPSARPRARSLSARRSMTISPKPRPRSRTASQPRFARVPCTFISSPCTSAMSLRLQLPMSPPYCKRLSRKQRSRVTPLFALFSISPR